MSRLALHLLGTPRIEVDGAPVSVERRKGIALLAYLAVTGRAHSRDALATLFWPEHDQVTARANLRRNLSVLHTSLHDEWLAVDHENVALPPANSLWVDVTEFRGCLRECRTNGLPDPAVCPQCIGRLESAAALYTDDFLAGFTLPDAPEFDDWQFRQAETLRAELSDALSQLVRCHSVQGNFDAAVSHAQRRVSLDPLHESSQCQLMEALARSGDKAGALRQYQALADLLRRELAAAPARDTAQLARVIGEDRLPPLAGQPAGVAAPPPAAVNGAAVNGHPAVSERERPRRHNLPAEVTSFVGREDELAEIDRWLHAPACRLITIVGPGGMGKTRLALQAAAAQVGRFEDGVYLVGLTAVSAKEFIAQSIASAIGVSLQGARDPWAALLGLLSTQHVLLMLDNLEQLLPDVDFVTELLQAAPQLKILATSRERLNLRSEWVYDLDGLRYPVAATEAGVEGFSAVELFVERAQQQRRDFSVRDALPCVLDICRLVGGMPLALELAAGWTRTMTCGEIVDELQRGIAILSTAQRDVPGRHRSMAAVFDHSWGLLTEAQQAAFRRLSVFRGGWTTDAAEQVAGADAAMLASLLDKSLIQRDAAGRWGMHELVRQYAEQQLRAAGEEHDANARHAEFVRELTNRAESELVMSRQLEWWPRLDAEQDNIRAALSWSFGDGDCRDGLGIAGALQNYWLLRGQFIEAGRWFEQAVECGRRFRPTRALTHALLGLARHFTGTGQLKRAEAVYREAIAFGQTVGPEAEEDVIHCRQFMIWIDLVDGELAKARSTVEELLAYRRRQAADGQEIYRDALSGVLYALSVVARAEGRLDAAEAALHEGLLIQKELGGVQGQALFLVQLGSLALLRGESAQARAFFEEGLVCCRRLNLTLLSLQNATGMAGVHAASGDYTHAAVLYGAVRALGSRLHVVQLPEEQVVHDGLISQATVALGQEEFDRFFRTGQGMTLEEALDAANQVSRRHPA
jgi:predicted ATPase/DNA-binding SARP family transcriptional activator